jgi:hypothetical protein
MGIIKDGHFWFGVIAGAGIFYLLHRVKGIPSNAPAKKA